jgi:hypothetical protein
MMGALALKSQRWVAVCTWIAAALLFQGCRHIQPPSRVDRPPWTGPTQDLSRIVAEINANNSRIPSVWSRHRYIAAIRDDKGHVDEAGGDGYLQYRAAGDLWFTGNKDIYGKVFEIGSNAERYWVKMQIPQRPTQMWWGNYANLGKPCVKSMPVQPDLLMEVLGIDVIPSDFTSEPAPVMRFNAEEHAYVIVWSYRTRDRWVAQKEVWFDRKDLWPTRVLLYDPRGRVQVRADLSKHQPVEGTFVGPPPVMATQYNLSFPESQTRMQIELEQPRIEYKGRPNNSTFRFPGTADVSEVIQIDEDCGS